MDTIGASKKISPEVEAPGIDEKDLRQLAQLAADKFSAAFEGIVSKEMNKCTQNSDER